jgi:hypothetical protein
MRITAYFFGMPGEALDKACRSIFEEIDGVKFIGAGTMLIGAAAGERDVEYDVPDEHVKDCRAALKKAGFRLEPTRDAA